jgi:hypothetical protein
MTASQTRETLANEIWRACDIVIMEDIALTSPSVTKHHSKIAAA